MKIRTVKTGASKKLSVIYKESVKGFFLISLWDNFLKTYYKFCIKSNDSIALCALDANENILTEAIKISGSQSIVVSYPSV